LAKLAGLGRDVESWKAVKGEALRGFVLCDDGLLYHHVIAETALTSAIKKRKRTRQTEAARAARNVKSNSLCNSDSNRDQGKRREREETVDGGEARARSPEDVSRETRNTAFELAVQIGDALGYGNDATNWPPNFCGSPVTIEGWLNGGWRADVIVDTVKAVMAKKKNGPPNSIDYFKRPIADAMANLKAPLPEGKVTHENTSRGAGAGSWQQSKDKFRGALDRFNAGIAAAESAGVESGEGGVQPLRLVTPTGRG
jgi:hypothetical protein